MTRKADRVAIWLKKRNILPGWLKRGIQKRFNVQAFQMAGWIGEDPFAGEPPEWVGNSPRPVLAILKEFWHDHRHYVAACRELGISYKIIDISQHDWQTAVNEAGCDAFLVRPSVQLSMWKQMFDERLRIMAEDMKKLIFPSLKELWFYESKRRTNYWLEANGIPHSRSWSFYHMDQALDFAINASLPIVFKSDLGSGSSGILIFRNRRALKRHITRCFTKGFSTYRRGPRDKEWGSVFLQEYVPNAQEWRIIRVGDSFFGYEKVQKGDFHSGSHTFSYGLPPLALLNAARDISDRHGFWSMDFDIFLTPDGRFLVNEMQPLFGLQNAYACMVDGKPGRMVYDSSYRQWLFEEGDFCRNKLYNLRVATVVDLLSSQTAIQSAAERMLDK